jgi:multidrug efflux system outer membrane protein
MSKQIVRLLVAFCAALAAGCTPVAKLDLPPPSHDPVVQATTVWHEGNGSWPAAEWWSSFSDTELSSLIRTVLAANPSLNAARAHAQAALAAADSQRGQVSSQFGVRATPGRQQISANGMFPAPFGGQTFTLMDLAGSLTYRLDLSGRLHAQVVSRAAEASAAKNDAQRASEAVAATAARLYFELAGGLADQSYVNELKHLYGRSRRLAEVRADQGLENEVNTRHIAAESEAFAEQVAMAGERVALTRGVLAALAGTGPDTMARLSPQPLQPIGMNVLPKDVRLRLLSRRADVRAARDRVESFAYDRIAAHRAYLPDLNFELLGGLQSRAIGSLFDSGSRQWNFAPVLSLPVFDGRQRAATSRAADAMYDAARAQYQEVVVRAVAEVNTALVSREGAAMALKAAAGSLAEEQLSLAAIKRRQAAGIAAEADVVKTKINVLERSREVARLLVRSRLADVDLIEALGGDTQEGSTP